MNAQELKGLMESRGHLLSDAERGVVCLYVYHGMSFNDIRGIIPGRPRHIYERGISKLEGGE